METSQAGPGSLDELLPIPQVTPGSLDGLLQPEQGTAGGLLAPNPELEFKDAFHVHPEGAHSGHAHGLGHDHSGHSFGHAGHDHLGHAHDHMGHDHSHFGHDHAGHAHDGHAHDGVGGLFEIPFLGLAFAGVGLYVMGRHWGDKDAVGTAGRGTLVGYTVIDGVAHAAPAVMAVSALGMLAGPLAVVGGVCLGAYAFYKGVIDQQKADENGSNASGMAFAGYTTVHAGYHGVIAAGGILGATAGHAHMHTATGILGGILGFIYNPIVQLGIAGLSLYMLYKEYKHHKAKKEALEYNNPIMNDTLALNQA